MFFTLSIVSMIIVTFDYLLKKLFFKNQSVPAAYDGPAITANGYNPSSYDYHTDPKIWIPRVRKIITIIINSFKIKKYS